MISISLEQAVTLIADGASLMVVGFMGVGTPERVIDELVRQGKRDLTLIANDTAFPGVGIGKMVPGMGGAMDLVTGAKRVVVAMQHSAKGKSKIVKLCTLPLTSVRPVDLVVTELAVIAFPGGRATLMETAPGVSVHQVIDATEAELVVPDRVLTMLVG